MAIANQTKTIVGVFNSVQDAQAAVRELESQGILRDNISIVANKNATGYDTMEDRDKASDVVADAGIGAAIGGVGGLLLSAAGAITIPVIGPVLAAGPIAAALTGAGIGAAAGGLIGALTESGVPEDDARTYAEGVRRGDVLVTVKADDAFVDRVSDILDRNDAVDVDERVSDWKNRGWSGWSDSATPYSSDDLRTERQYYRSGRDTSITGNTGGIGREGLPSGGGYGSTAAGNASYIDDTARTDARDRDRDGWVADDKMRDATHDAKRSVEHAGREAARGAREVGHDIKEGAQRLGRKMGDAAHDAKESVKDTFDRDDAAYRRRRARVYDRTL